FWPLPACAPMPVAFGCTSSGLVTGGGEVSSRAVMVTLPRAMPAANRPGCDAIGFAFRVSDDTHSIGAAMTALLLSNASAVKVAVSWKNTDDVVDRKRTPAAWEPGPT